jgi:hypothetical protein
MPQCTQRLWSATVCFLALAFASIHFAASAAAPPPDQIIDGKLHQLGKRAKQDQSQQPRLDVPFDSAPNATEFTLLIAHRGVVQPWFLEVNGRPLAPFPLSYNIERDSYFILPAGLLTNGSNTLSFVGADFGKEISVGNVRLFRQPLRERLNLRTVAVTVTDDQTGKPVPARITIRNERGEAPDIFSVSATNTAVRAGLIYTTGRKTAFDLPAGRYEFAATRGMEWGLARKTMTLAEGATAVDLRLRRQVNTSGFIAADTHIHNVTFSGHGDVTIEERMLTLAGEGVELAVATDHNHHTDYEPYQTRLGLNPFFTPVTGNEVTTKNGHLNGFPMPPGGPVPNHLETNWVKLVADIRLKGAKVVILNHPRYPDPQNTPLTKFRFNRASGDRFNGPAFTFDAMELVNASSPSTLAREELVADPLRLLTDWFAIQNRGEKITGVGGSDSHTVNIPVGQGRTYIRSSTDEPARLDVDELCRHFLAGDTSVSYGIFAEVTVNERYHPGDLVRPADGKVQVSLRVAAADWVKPRRALVFLNGLPVAEKPLEPKPGEPFDQRLEFSIPVPKHDAYLVCAVFGDGITEPFWTTLARFTAAVVNPLYVDGDGDGKYQSPRETARQILAATDGTLPAVWEKLDRADDALAGQMLGLLYLGRDADFLRQLDARVRSAAESRKLYQTFLENSPQPTVKPKAGQGR